MKLSKTLKVKIGKLSNNKTNLLDVLIRKNIKAINLCLQKAKEGNYITHDLVYKDLRKMNLPSTVICGCRDKSVEIIKSYNKQKNKKIFPILRNSRVRFDNKKIKLRHTDNKLYPKFISLLYKAGQRGNSNNRMELPLIINSDYQKDIIQQIGYTYKLGATELVKKNNNFYVYISYSKDIKIPEADETFTPVGIDIGIRNLAVVSVAQQQPKFFNGKRVRWKRNFYFEQRRKLFKNFALQEVKRLRGMETRYLDIINHNISKQIINIAKRTDKPVIIMEDLKGITKYKIWTKRGNRMLSNWTFKRLQKAIEYKALWEGIPVEYIEPKNTSKTCSKCGELNNRNKDKYKCNNCGYEINADLNATFNIRKFWLDKFQSEKTQINCVSDDAISEPQAEKNSNSLCNLYGERNNG